MGSRGKPRDGDPIPRRLGRVVTDGASWSSFVVVAVAVLRDPVAGKHAGVVVGVADNGSRTSHAAPAA
jgi:hypothetical protein